MADCFISFFFQAEDGIRDRSPSRGLGDVYKRQPIGVDTEEDYLALKKIMEYKN